MIQIKKTSYKGLRKLSLSERMKAIQNPNVGQFLFSALTPTQYAELFPRYYRDQLPDVGMLALPSSASKMRQAAVADQRVTQAVEGSDTGILGKIKQKLGLGKTAMVTKPGVTVAPQLTPEDLMTYNAIKNQPLPADDPRVKFLSGLSEEQLKAGGLQKVKDEQTGKEMFKYVAPTDEQAAEKLRAGTATSDSATAKAASERYVGRKLSDHEWNLLQTTTAAEATSHKGETAMVMASILNRLRSGKYGDSVDSVVSARQQFSTHANGKAYQEPGGKRRNSIYESAAMLEGISHNQTDFASANPKAYDTATDGGGGERKIAQRLQKGFTQVGGQIFNAASESKLLSGPEQPAGPNGQYTTEQLERAKAQIAKGQIGSLAAFTTAQQGAYGAPGTSVQYQKTKDFRQFALSPGVDNYTSNCGRGARVMAGHMFNHDSFIKNGLGADGTAGSLSHGNNYFQRSGLFEDPKSTTREQLRNQAFLDSLPIGTIITSSGGKSGGNNGQGHAQIKIGPNTWASDTVQSHLLTGGSHGVPYDNFTIHKPNGAGIERLRENGVSQSLPTETPTATASTAGQEHPSSEYVSRNMPTQQLDTDTPELISGRTEQPKAKVEVKTTGAPDYMQTPGAQPPDAVQPPAAALPAGAPPQPKNVTFTLNKKSYLDEIERKHPAVNAPIVGPGREGAWKQTMDGLKDVPHKLTKEGNVVITLPENDPRIARVRQDMKDNQLDEKTFLQSKVEEEKKKEEVKKVETPPEVKPQPQQTQVTEQQKPLSNAEQMNAIGRGEKLRYDEKGNAFVTNKPTQPAPPAPAPQAAPEPPKPGEPPKAKVEVKPTTVDHQATPAPQATTAPATPQTPPPAPPKQEPPKVPSKAEGGDVKVKGEVAAYPINGLRGDNSLVIDTKTQQPLFTMNPSREAMVPTPENNRANIVPTDKVNPQDVAKPAASGTDQITKDLQALRQEVGTAFENLSTGDPKDKAVPKGAPQDRDPDMIGTLLQRTKVPYSNPTAMRAFSRARFNETGDATSDFHHSTGNSNTV